MDALRHHLATLLVVGLPVVAGYWLLIHPLAGFWRRIGPAAALGMVLAALAGGVAVLLPFRHFLHGRDLGHAWPAQAAGWILVGLAGWMRIRIGRHFSLSTLVGWRELSESGSTRTGLVTDGVHARVRHPRYVQLLVAFAGWSLVAHHAGSYLAVALWVPATWAIVLLEERELHRRFGAEYAAYCRRVPRFIPRRAPADVPTVRT